MGTDDFFRARLDGMIDLRHSLAVLAQSQHSIGDKASLGSITKRGDDDLRTLLIQGAKSAVIGADKRRDRISRWLVQLKERVGWQKAGVAMANTNARILWAVLTRGIDFNVDHVSETPAARSSPRPAPAPNSSPIPHPDVRSKMPATGQTGGRRTR